MELGAAQADSVAERQFETFFRDSYPRVFRAVLLVTRDAGEAEDSTATAFLRAWEQWHRLSEHPAPLAWVTRVAINDSITWWRRARRRLTLRPAVRDEDAVSSFPDPDLAAAIASLPLRQRQVLALRILVGLDVAETASALGIADGTVTAHLHRALESCRKRLQLVDVQEERS
jgi:RNA polymerase sigma factor (sigma-70 family)